MVFLNTEEEKQAKNKVKNNDINIKFKIQRFIVSVSILLLLSKLLAYQLTNSVGILTDALESIVNVIAGLLSLLSISVSIKPKDDNHPFGHGKIELLSASVEGMLIAVAGFIIIYEAFYRFFFPSNIQKLDIGIIIIAIAGIINYILGAYSIKIGKKHRSIALVAGGRHLQSDTYSTIGLIAGLIILYFTNILWLDSVIAVIFGTIISVTGIRILRQTISNLMDEADIKLLEEFLTIINKNRKDEWIKIRNIRIIKYGDSFHIDCDLTIPWYYNINQAKQISEEMTEILNKNFEENIDLAVHINPCQPKNCIYCIKSDCSHRKSQFQKKIEWTVEHIIQFK